MFFSSHTMFYRNRDFVCPSMKQPYSSELFPFFKDSSSDCLRPKLWPDPAGQPANTTGYLILSSFLFQLSVTVFLPLSKSAQLTLSPLTDGGGDDKQQNVDPIFT